MKKNNVIGVVGLGYVGLPLALLTASNNYEVIGIDNDERKITAIKSGKSPIADPYLEKMITKVRISASANPRDLNRAQTIIICVPTPVDDYQPDLDPLKSACEDVARNMKKDTLVIVESTINPGVCDDVVIPLLEQISGMKAGKDFDIAHCPERINPGDTKWSINNINRVVGSYSGSGLKRALSFYKSIIDADIKPMSSLKEAEAVKIVENSFRDINIAFVNELAMSFHRLGINLENVIDGAATKPFAFMPHRPGCGVGGHCIPVDPYYLIEYARGFGFNHDFLTLARRINNQMPEFTVELLQDALNEARLPMNGSKITLLGLAYKPDVDDDRESPAYEIQDLLAARGASVTSYDPYLPHKSDVNSLDKALQSADAVLIATGHTEFKKLASNLLNKHKSIKAIVDGRNLLRLEREKLPKKLVYVGIGA
jgi:nucleotide sugar dehydrogenase